MGTELNACDFGSIEEMDPSIGELLYPNIFTTIGCVLIATNRQEEGRVMLSIRTRTPYHTPFSILSFIDWRKEAFYTERVIIFAYYTVNLRTGDCRNISSCFVFVEKDGVGYLGTAR